MTTTHKAYVRGILFKILNVVSIVLMLALIKLIEGVPVSQVMFFRCFFSILPVACVLMFRGQIGGALRTARPFAHVTRTVLGLAVMALTFIAVRVLPLPEVVTLQYSQPLFVVAFSALFLREVVGIYRWGAVAFGFVGVLVITWPQFSMMSETMTRAQLIGIAATLISAAGMAVSLLLVGQLVRTERPTTIVSYFWLISSAVLATTSIWGWEPLTGGQITILVMSGILGGLAQLFMGESLRWAPASVTASFEYLSLLFAISLGFYAFGDIPGANTLVGAIILVSAGLIIIWRQRQRGVDQSRHQETTSPS